MFTTLTTSAANTLASDNNVSKNNSSLLINLENDNNNIKTSAITSLNNANSVTNTISITKNKNKLKVPDSLSQSTLNGCSNADNNCLIIQQHINLLNQLVLAACNNFNLNQQGN
jgi:hypothetical protein